MFWLYFKTTISLRWKEFLVSVSSLTFMEGSTAVVAGQWQRLYAWG